jgi:hypothetical protein
VDKQRFVCQSSFTRAVLILVFLRLLRISIVKEQGILLLILLRLNKKAYCSPNNIKNIEANIANILINSAAIKFKIALISSERPELLSNRASSSRSFFKLLIISSAFCPLGIV